MASGKKLTMRGLWASLNAVDPTVHSKECMTVADLASHLNTLIALGYGSCEVETRDTNGDLCGGVVVRKLNDENTVQVVGEQR